ncbi:MAG: BatA domain-containing protein, partial [Rhodospirillaceae bacterium]
MIGLGALSVAAPWALAGLVALPLIWWLLRLRPPVPTRVVFPPLELLRRLVARRESPVRIPPWLLLLRLAMAALVVAGLAQPLLDAENRLFGSGPLYLVVDDDWAAAGRWPQRRAAMLGYIEDAARTGRPVVVVRTAPPPEGAQPAAIQLMTGANARRAVEGFQPRPWNAERRAAVERLLDWAAVTERRPGDVIWLSNGIEAKDGPAEVSMAELTRRLRPFGAVQVLADAPARAPVILRPPRNTGGELMLVAERPAGAGAGLPARGISVRGLDEDGQLVARVPLVFAADAARAEAVLELPAELRNRLARLEVAGAESAAAVILVDERWRRRPVGLILRSAKGAEQPLLDPNHYLLQALAPFTEVRRGSVPDLLQRPTAVLIMADGDTPAPEEQAPLTAWLDKGGILVRFAGPRLARDAGGDDKFLPVRLRRGNRVIGGALSWRKPEALAPFPETGPFHGIAVPPDVRVRRQVLAEPSLDLAAKTWARLADGTPLVTAEKKGEGWIVLVHTTADGTWADLSFSGLFVDMLRRLVDFSQGVVGAGAAGAPAPPIANLDAFGTLGTPPGGATAISAADLEAGKVGPGHPPGFY